MDDGAGTAAGKTRADGRKQRSVRSRDRIKSSIIALIRDGNFAPRAVDVSEHSGLSMRTVFRHIDDMESLVREIAADLQKEVLPKFLKPYASTDWRAQLEEQVARRIEIWDYILPIRVTGSLRRFRSKFIMEEYRYVLDFERASLKAVLPEEIAADEALFAALNQAMGIGCWVSLRIDQAMSAEQAETVVRRTVAALIANVE